MAVIQSGALATSLLTVDNTMNAARMSERPPQILGAYNIGATSGAMTGVAAGQPVFSWRWAPATTTNLCMVRRVTVGFSTTTAFTTAQSLQYSMQIARSWTASDTGGTALLFTNVNSSKMRTSMPTSGFAGAGDIRIGSTGAVTAGTRTLDTNPIAYVQGFSSAVGATMGPTDLFWHSISDYPLILANNEGFIINNVQLMGATGVINLTVMVEWMELDGNTAPGISF